MRLANSPQEKSDSCPDLLPTLLCLIPTPTISTQPSFLSQQPGSFELGQPDSETPKHVRLQEYSKTGKEQPHIQKLYVPQLFTTSVTEPKL